MGREDVLQRLRAAQGKLADFHIKSLAIFGSVARDEARPDSDVDVLVEFDGPATFDRYMDLKQFLEATLDGRVDLLTRNGLRQELVPYIEQDLLRVA